ncbi:hypothetical protein JZ751_028232 [Albula glossodonta]|uniref:Uncharacterized protein n=1 Tax=Albula glossodonta TaxID=121402 RepID=A0A8T2NBJ3_9TELE|nr:hypothetical protein JZ751_028232 [Albula glossodonta]
MAVVISRGGGLGSESRCGQGTRWAAADSYHGSRRHIPAPVPITDSSASEMEALASMMIVATLSSRISFSKGVGSRLSSSILTDSVSLEMRKRRTSSSNRSRPGGEGEVKEKEEESQSLLFN